MTVALTAWDLRTWDKSPQMVRALWRTFRHPVDRHHLHGLHAVQERVLHPRTVQHPAGCVHTCPPADPLLDLHTTDERSYRGKVGIKMFNLQLSFKARNSKSNSNSDKFKMCLIFKVLSFKEGSATPCPSTTPVQWCSTRTRSRSRSSSPRRSSRWMG